MSLYHLRLMREERLEYFLTQEEIAKIIVTEAENESERCYKYIVGRIQLFREQNNNALHEDFLEQYSPSFGSVNLSHPYSHLLDLSNTIINWLEYTQLVSRNRKDEESSIRILPEKENEIDRILDDGSTLIDRPHEQEYFQRKFGLDPNHQKDNRNLSAARTVTHRIIMEQQIRQAFITQSLHEPISRITTQLIESISERAGVEASVVEDTLHRLYPHGAIGSFMVEYFEMAFRGRDNATDFEIATANLFGNVFGFASRHVGPIGRTPDVLLISDNEGYQAIIDNKAYASYSISNDHHNRMVQNYITGIQSYGSPTLPLVFFSYIAGGFSANIEAQLNRITQESNVHGSAISVSNIISLVERHQQQAYSHAQIRSFFSLDKCIQIADLDELCNR